MRRLGRKLFSINAFSSSESLFSKWESAFDSPKRIIIVTYLVHFYTKRLWIVCLPPWYILSYSRLGSFSTPTSSGAGNLSNRWVSCLGTKFAKLTYREINVYSEFCKDSSSYVKSIYHLKTSFSFTWKYFKKYWWILISMNCTKSKVFFFNFISLLMISVHVKIIDSKSWISPNCST